MKAQAAQTARSIVAEPAKHIIPVEPAKPVNFRMNPTSKRRAFGQPGVEPRWTHGDKDGVGTAYAASSRIWFTPYVKLLRSVSDGRVIDLIPEVAGRYLGDHKGLEQFEIWKFNRQNRSVKKGFTLRIQAAAAFCLHWSANEWTTVEDTPSLAPVLGFHFVDIPISDIQRAPIGFTFFWTAENRWEGRDYAVAVE